MVPTIISQCLKNMNMCRSNDECNLKLVCWICYMSMSVLSLQLRGTSAQPILIDLYTFGQNIEDYICCRLHWPNYVLYQCSVNIKVCLLKNCNIVGCGDDGDANDSADGAEKHLVHLT